jgi:hypothetical protein
LWTFDQILLPFKAHGSGICCPVSVERHLLREAGSVLCKLQTSHLCSVTYLELSNNENMWDVSFFHEVSFFYSLLSSFEVSTITSFVPEYNIMTLLITLLHIYQ